MITNTLKQKNHSVCNTSQLKRHKFEDFDYDNVDEFFNFTPLAN